MIMWIMYVIGLFTGWGAGNLFQLYLSDKETGRNLTFRKFVISIIKNPKPSEEENE